MNISIYIVNNRWSYPSYCVREGLPDNVLAWQGCEGQEVDWDVRMDLARERLELQRNVKIVISWIYCMSKKYCHLLYSALPYKKFNRI